LSNHGPGIEAFWNRRLPSGDFLSIKAGFIPIYKKRLDNPFYKMFHPPDFYVIPILLGIRWPLLTRYGGQGFWLYWEVGLGPALYLYRISEPPSSILNRMAFDLASYTGVGADYLLDRHWVLFLSLRYYLLSAKHLFHTPAYLNGLALFIGVGKVF